MRQNRQAFTLIEISISVVILLLILMLGIPSMNGLMADRRLHRSLDDLNRLVQKAQQRSVADRRSYLISWEKDGIILRPEALAKGESEDPVAKLPFKKGDKYQLKLPAALTSEAPPAQWIFWPTGTCEPAIVTYKGANGSWTANYGTLSARANLTSYAAK